MDNGLFLFKDKLIKIYSKEGDDVNKKRIIISFLSMVLALFAFMLATYAWFAVSTSVENSPLNINVDPGIITSYETRMYTYDNIYKTTSSSSSILRYDSVNGWVAATHRDPEDIAALEIAQGEDYDSNDFWGVVMKPYDTLITENNLVNNLILGIHLTYEVDVDTYVSITANANEAIGEAARDAFGVLDGADEELYLSHVVDFQMLPATSTDTLHGFDTNNNLYFTLMTPTYFENTTTYPYSNFYDVSEAYVDTIVFYDDTISPYELTATSGDVYIYFNISYNVDNITDSLTGLISGGFSEIQLYRFFQDITLIVRKEGESS